MMNPEQHPDTRAVRAGTQRSQFSETSEAMFLNSGYVYETAAEAAAAFAGEIVRHRYSRVSNPTTSMLQERMAALEGAEAGWATASGMSAVFNALLACTKQGSRIVAARAMFGSCHTVLTEILPRYGVTCELVDGTDLDAWAAALATPADAVFFESPSNPMQELVDIAAVSEVAHAAGATVVVDNAFLAPTVQYPLQLGADVVTYSTTKHADGQGRTLGGMVLGTAKFISEDFMPFMRHTGPIMSPFNAWVVLKGLETLPLRRDRMSSSALELAAFLEQRPEVAGVRYPFLASHPQHELAKRQMSSGGSVITFDVVGAQPEAFAFLDAMQLIDISNNFADAKSLAVHNATTTHHRIGPQARAEAGITDATIRLSVGLEDVDDLRADLAQALDAIAAVAD